MLSGLLDASVDKFRFWLGCFRVFVAPRLVTPFLWLSPFFRGQSAPSWTPLDPDQLNLRVSVFTDHVSCSPRLRHVSRPNSEFEDMLNLFLYF